MTHIFGKAAPQVSLPPPPPLPEVPTAPAPPPQFGSIQGQKPGKKSMAPTFLGAGATPSPTMGAPLTLMSGGGGTTRRNTLLGQ